MLKWTAISITECVLASLLERFEIDPDCTDCECRRAFVRGVVHGVLGMPYDDGVGIPHDLIVCVPIDGLSSIATAYRRGFLQGRAARVTNN